MLSVIMLNVFMLTGVMLSAFIHCVHMLSGIFLNAMQSALMHSVHMLSVIILGVVLLSVTSSSAILPVYCFLL